MKTYNIAIVGATSIVGQEMIAILEQREFPVNELRVWASEDSASERLPYNEEKLIVQQLTDTSFDDLDICLFSAGESISRQFTPYAVKAGAVVIDSTNAFRMNPDVPLIVPEVNAHAMASHQGIIASPNCSTIQLSVALNPIHEAIGIKRIVVSTYQPVSEAGKGAIEELDRQIRQILNHRDILCQVFPHQIAFNCLPHIDVFSENGYTSEEIRLVHETRKILEDDSLRMTATAVYIPVYYGHSAAVNIELEEKLTSQEVRDLLANAPGVRLVDDPQKNMYPLALETVGEDQVFIGRIREDESIDNGINMWIVADNLRKGAALNAIQIAELLIYNLP